MKKKKLYFFLIVFGIVVFIIIMIAAGGIALETFSQNDETKSATSTVDDLMDNCYYIWHNPKTNDITKDLTQPAKIDVFKLCPSGTVNWGKDSLVTHTIWFTGNKDKNIPTLYAGDKLLYVSSNNVPYDGIEWERFSDYGYTIGVANMIGDESGHYHISNENGKGFDGYVCSDSDANQLNENFSTVSNLFLDKIGGIKIRENEVSKGGTASNLVKNKEYICEWYTGTIYQDFKMTANVHTFGFLESFTTYDYEFLHSNCIEIAIPSWFKTGYYYVDGIGMFRYVSKGDESLYNGEEFDDKVNWNDPIILYDENDNLIYDPSTGVDKRNGDENGNVSTENNGDNTKWKEDIDHTDYDIPEDQDDIPEDEGDTGADGYDDFGNETIINDENTVD